MFNLSYVYNYIDYVVFLFNFELNRVGKYANTLEIYLTK